MPYAPFSMITPEWRHGNAYRFAHAGMFVQTVTPVRSDYADGLTGRW
jgi:hypothetical protein